MAKSQPSKGNRSSGLGMNGKTRSGKHGGLGY
jgi:hypothetical protein